MVKVEEYRPEGTRNFIRVGDRVQVIKGGVDKRGFEAIVRSIDADEDGTIRQVEVIPRTGKYAGKIRTLPVERVERKAQTKNGKRIEVKR